MNRKEVLETAENYITSDREQQYGSPEDNFAAIAEFWNVYLNRKYACAPISSDDVAILMTLLKLARIATGKFKEDSYIDAIGYLACGAEIASKNDDCHKQYDFFHGSENDGE